MTEICKPVFCCFDQNKVELRNSRPLIRCCDYDIVLENPPDLHGHAREIIDCRRKWCWSIDGWYQRDGETQSCVIGPLGNTNKTYKGTVGHVCDECEDDSAFDCRHIITVGGEGFGYIDWHGSEYEDNSTVSLSLISSEISGSEDPDDEIPGVQKEFFITVVGEPFNPIHWIKYIPFPCTIGEIIQKECSKVVNVTAVPAQYVPECRGAGASSPILSIW